MNEFKAGDLVFVLSRTKGVLLCSLEAGENDWLYANKQMIDEAGFLPHQYSLTYVIHATPENREALVTLYGEEAVPKLPPSPSEIAKKLLKNQKYIIASVSDESDESARECRNIRLIVSHNNDYFTDDMGGIYRFAVPIDFNGNEIMEVTSE